MYMMPVNSYVLAFLVFPFLNIASPITSSPSIPSALLHPRCGTVSQYYNPKLEDWNKNNLNDWLDKWWKAHGSDISANGGGFAGAFGQWALGDPDRTCRDDGNTDNCDLDVCDSRVLNDKGNDMRQAYYVLQATNHLHGYFLGLAQSFEVSAIGAALSKDQWATKFYKDKDVKSVTVLKEMLNLVQTIIGIGAAVAGLGPAAAGAVGGAASALFSGGVGAASPLIGQQ